MAATSWLVLSRSGLEGEPKGQKPMGTDAMIQSEAQKRLLLEGGVQLHFHGRRHHL